jgi:hypothetical protein
MDPGPKNRDAAELDLLLGGKANFTVKEVQGLGGPSPQTLYRARQAGLIEFVKNGVSNTLTRGTTKHILLRGLGPIPFTYGRQAASRKLIGKGKSA